jgi:hypothetical protein
MSSQGAGQAERSQGCARVRAHEGNPASAATRPPAVIADIGGGPGRYAAWLAELGYTVEHRDPMALHVEQVRASSGLMVHAEVGDARGLDLPDSSVDAVLLLGSAVPPSGTSRPCPGPARSLSHRRTRWPSLRRRDLALGSSTGRLRRRASVREPPGSVGDVPRGGTHWEPAAGHGGRIQRIHPSPEPASKGDRGSPTAARRACPSRQPTCSSD